MLANARGPGASLKIHFAIRIVYLHLKCFITPRNFSIWMPFEIFSVPIREKFTFTICLFGPFLHTRTQETESADFSIYFATHIVGHKFLLSLAEKLRRRSRSVSSVPMTKRFKKRRKFPKRQLIIHWIKVPSLRLFFARCLENSFF